MKDGALTVEIDTPEPDDDSATLSADVLCILIDCHRDRDLTAMRPDAPSAALKALAEAVARRLAPRIGGRYVPKRDGRAARDAAVWRAFNGRNHGDVMREFGISRRLLYSILSRRRRMTA